MVQFINHSKDIVHQLASRDLGHILDLIFSFLDLETLVTVELVSPLWSRLVSTSNVVHRTKVGHVISQGLMVYNYIQLYNNYTYVDSLCLSRV